MDAIQEALQAIGSTDKAPPSDVSTQAIEDALSAIDYKPPVVPDKGPKDFLTGGYDHAAQAARRAVGGSTGLLNDLTTLPGMIVGGLAAGPAAGLHALFPNTMPTGQQALEEGEDLFQIHPGGEYGEGADITQGVPGRALGAVTSGAGDLSAMLSGWRPQSYMRSGRTPPAVAPQPKLKQAQDAQREALSRTAGEAISNALLAVGLGKGGEGVLEGRPEVPGKSEMEGTSPSVEPQTAPQVPPETDFQARMADAAPKASKPEPITPAVQEANVSSLEAPYRATPADAVSVMPKLPKYLQGAKPKMGKQGLNFASDLDKAAYIVSNPRTSSARHADYLEWLSKALGTDENTALFLAKRSKAATVAVAKAGSGDVPAYLKPAAPGTPVHPLPAPEVTEAVPGAPATVPGSPLEAVDKALEGTRLTRTPIPPGGSMDRFVSMNNLRIGTGEGQPLPYTQYVRDVYPSAEDEVISTIGERVLQDAKGDPTRMHLSPQDLQALNRALGARGWPKHRVDTMEKVAAALDYARQNRQLRNEGYAPMRAALQDHKLLGDMLKHPENYALTARLDEFKPAKDFEKVCTP